MTVPTACIHLFHDDPRRGESYEVNPGGTLTGVGYRCPDCGFETVRTFTANIVIKPCSSCDNSFEGLDAIEDELCTPCFMVELRKLIADERARRVRLRRIHTAYGRRRR